MLVNGPQENCDIFLVEYPKCYAFNKKDNTIRRLDELIDNEPVRSDVKLDNQDSYGQKNEKLDEVECVLMGPQKSLFFIRTPERNKIY